MAEEEENKKEPPPKYEDRYFKHETKPEKSTDFLNETLQYEFRYATIPKKKINSEDKEITKNVSYIIKKLTFKDQEKFKEFSEFTDRVLEFQEAQIPGFLYLCDVFKYEELLKIILVQKDHKKTLTHPDQCLNTEVELLNFLRMVTKFYYQIKQEDIFEEFVKPPLPFKRLSVDTIFLYEKNIKVRIKELTATQRFVDVKQRFPYLALKVDLLAIDKQEFDKHDEKIDKTNFHLREFERIICESFQRIKTKNERLGVCSKNLLRKIEGRSLVWKDFLTHPLFKADFEIQPNLELWILEGIDGRKINDASKEKFLSASVNTHNVNPKQKSEDSIAASLSVKKTEQKYLIKKDSKDVKVSNDTKDGKVKKSEETSIFKCSKKKKPEIKPKP